jgi:hypothetical protein
MSAFKSGPEAPMRSEIVPVSLAGEVVDGETGSEDMPINETTEVSGQLDETEKQLIVTLAKEIVSESDTVRRWQLQRIRKSRDYYNGRQWQVWSAEKQTYIPMAEVPASVYGGETDDEDDDPIYTWNLYKATGEFIASIITGSSPTVRFYPENASNPMDIATAKAASDIVKIFHRTNDIDNILDQEAFYLYNDGMFAAYVRHVKDKARFGTRTVPVMGMVPYEIAPAMNVCGRCGFPGPEIQQPEQCGQCGAVKTPESNVPAQMGEREDQVGEREEVNGAEVLDLYGALDVRVPPEARELQDAMYLIHQQEVDPAIIATLYPAAAQDKSFATANTSDIGIPEERMARAQQSHALWMSGPFSGTDENYKRVTYTKIWLRPAAFNRIEDPATRQKMLSLFRDGAFFAYAGNTYLESRNECMDDYWVLCHAYPGDTSMRPSIGESMLDPQDALNDLMYSEMQVARHSVGALFVDSNALDPDYVRQSRVRGGMMMPVRRIDGEPIGSNFFAMEPAGINPQAVGLRQEIFGGISQYLSGTLPGVTGQSDPNLKTAKAYAQAREQAMGRIAMIWRQMKRAHSRIASLAVKHFIANRSGDFSFSELTPYGFKDKVIKYADLGGQIIAYPEMDEAYPVSASDRREQLLNLLGTGNPILSEAVVSPENFDYFKSAHGLAGLKLPGEAARNKQFREIQKLLQAEPIIQEIPEQLSMDPNTGQPIMQPPQQIETPSIPVEQIMDDHQAEFRACQIWLNSEEGEEALTNNPQGHRNVVLHGEAHFNAMMSMQSAQQGPPQ